MHRAWSIAQELQVPLFLQLNRILCLALCTLPFALCLFIAGGDRANIDLFHSGADGLYRFCSVFLRHNPQADQNFADT